MKIQILGLSDLFADCAGSVDDQRRTEVIEQKVAKDAKRRDLCTANDRFVRTVRAFLWHWRLAANTGQGPMLLWLRPKAAPRSS